MPPFKRKVFYLSGFDPRGGRYYHRLYREEAVKYAGLAQESITVGQRTHPHDYETAWSVSNQTALVETDYAFLCWEDLVTHAWIKNPLALLWRSAKAFYTYVRYTLHRQTLSLPLTPLIAFFYPFLALFIIPILLVWIALTNSAALASHLGLPVLLTSLATSALALAFSAWLFKKAKALWLLRLYIFNAEAFVKPHAALEERLEYFKERILEALSGDYDEVLLVAHSHGCVLAFPLLEKILRARGGELPANFRVLTLAHCIPMASCLNNAPAYKEQMNAVAQASFFWLDIGYPPDGACYALTNPFMPYFPDHRPEVHLVSPRFFKYHSPEDYKRIKRNKYRLHFHYLMCGQTLSPLNYIRITSGKDPLPALLTQFKAQP